MRSINVWWRQEPADEQAAAGRYHPGHDALIDYRGRRYRLKAGGGSEDNGYAFREGRVVYLLSLNRSMGYAGVEAFLIPTGGCPRCRPRILKPHASAFVQFDWEVREALGPAGVDLEPATIARRLACQLEAI